LPFLKKKIKEFLCIIPARAGSKGVKNKNIKLLGGKPLIYWTIKEALKIKEFSKVIVSTDSKKIQNISKKYGAECPFLRPKNISRDKSLTIDVIKHAVKYLDAKSFDKFENIVLLQPTSPFRKKIDIKNAIQKFLKNKRASSLISVVEVGDFHPARMYYINNNKLEKNKLSESKVGRPRQNLKTMYLRNGAIYIIKKKNINGNFLGTFPIGFLMPKDRSLNIDDNYDFEIAKNYIKKI
jgi:CMP-N-acetylneuraminic acid synthetase